LTLQGKFVTSQFCQCIDVASVYSFVQRDGSNKRKSLRHGRTLVWCAILDSSASHILSHVTPTVKLRCATRLATSKHLVRLPSPRRGRRRLTMSLFFSFYYLLKPKKKYLEGKRGSWTGIENFVAIERQFGENKCRVTERVTSRQFQTRFGHNKATSSPTERHDPSHPLSRPFKLRLHCKCFISASTFDIVYARIWY
jgi:hypothetical protein